MTTTATRETAPHITRIATLLLNHKDFLAKHRIHGIPGLVDYITTPGYGHRYDPDNPLPTLANRIGRIGAHTSGIRRRNRYTKDFTPVSEENIREGMLLMDIANSIDSLSTGGEPVGHVSA